MYLVVVYCTAVGIFALCCFIVKLIRIPLSNPLTILNDFKLGKKWMAAIFQVNTEVERHGGELVAAVLKTHGIDHIFSLCGGHISPILVACEALGIRVIDTRHEANAVFAADAVARLKQDIGVAVVTAGPGITNSITALKNAQMAESPLLLLGGASPSLLKGRGALQDIDQKILIKPLCKFTATVRIVRDIIPVIREAIMIAKSDTPGPVFVEIPIDCLYPFKIVEKETGFSKNPKGIKKLIDFFLRLYVYRLFGCAWHEQNLTPLPIRMPMFKQEQINQLLDMTLKAKKPLILMGSQAMLPPIKTENLRKTIEALGIPIYLGGMSRGLLGINSRLNMRHNRKEAVQNADLIILAGSVCDFRLSYGRVLNPHSNIVTINRDRKQMLKNHGIFWRSSLAIQSDVSSTLVELQHHLFAIQPDWEGAPTNWIEELFTRDLEKEKAIDQKTLEETMDGRLNPLQVLKCLDSILTDETILIADGGDFIGSAAYIVRPRGPFKWLDPGAFGTLGVGAGFALGAKVVFPECPVVILYGDGASGFSLIEFDTFARHKLPIVAVIGNDACWSQISRDQVPWFKSNVACQLAYTNYEEVAKGLAAEGIRMESGMKTEEICQKFLQCIRKSKEREGKPSVINVLIGKTNFREGSISV